MKKGKIVFTVVLLISLTKLSGQSDLESALNYWQNGEVLKAHNELLKIVNASPGNEEAKYLLMKSFFIQGQYNEALEIFTKLNDNFEKHTESIDLAIQANIHLRDYNNAYLLAKLNDSKQLSYLEVLKNKRFTIIADKIYRVQFLHDDKISSDIWPGVTGRINGVQSLIRFDTGADYMIGGKVVQASFTASLESLIK
jgi:tetratricopeptide (TPR) repeat protein